MKNNYEKIFQTSLLLIFVLMGILAVLKVPTEIKEIDIHPLIKHTLYIGLSYVCYSLYWLGVAGVKFYKNKKEIVVSIVIVVAIYILYQNKNEWIHFATSVIALLLPALRRNKMTVEGYIIFIVFGILHMMSKGLTISMVNTTNENKLIYLIIDLIIFLGINYLYRVNGGKKKWLFGMNRFLEIKKNILERKEKKNKRKLEKQMIKSKLSTMLLIELRLQQILTLIAFSGITIGYAAYKGKALEYVTMFVFYYVLRGTFEKEFHTSPNKCIVVSLGVFVFAINNMLPFEISILSSVVVALAIDFSTCHLQNYIDLQKDKNFNLKTCTINELEDRCLLNGIRGQEKEICIDIFTSGMKIQEIADKHGFERGTIANKKTKYRKILERELQIIEQPL